ncbi:hypothetical protein E0485_11205 [Paenibacillus albiflavus]|uniref:DUF559 domain-containing protein n=1 Tax=Paenibacillus albiflavus TaxID=2545760 RepID=A0A4R4EFM6_9BACL|nr:hypothetical protein [Paenibacillus albiflavus]TCZ77031.1 hypothetical protein E0485_11205 [Paenibacillus albiflavus]
MSFEAAHCALIEDHLSRRSGERKGRLERGHAHAERLLLHNVWWPLFGSFEQLHPEYEVYDWNRKSVFLDFAFLPSFGRIGIECDGYQSHVRDLDREGFSYSLKRDAFLTGLGWKMIHFSYDDVKERPEVCRMLLQMVIGPHLMQEHKLTPARVIEKEVLRLAWQLGKPIRPIDVSSAMDVNHRTACKWLRSLVDKGWLRPIPTARGVLYYEVELRTLQHLV